VALSAEMAFIVNLPDVGGEKKLKKRDIMFIVSRILKEIKL